MILDTWQSFYLACVKDMHLRPERPAGLDVRLSDWGQEAWDS